MKVRLALGQDFWSPDTLNKCRKDRDMPANKEMENRNFQSTVGYMIMLGTFNINSRFSFLKANVTE